MTDINDIASKHLGRDSAGNLVQKYETPSAIDKSLLVGVPRHLNRTAYGITEPLSFVGFDSWNCYEFSTLLTNGFPVTGLVRIVYRADSPNIVESKSLKLYLNSFNMVRIKDTIHNTISYAKDIIRKDLTDCIGSPVDVRIHLLQDGYDEKAIPILHEKYTTIENDVRIQGILFDQYNEDPNILVKETMMSANDYWHSSVLRSNCRVTNQPDWGDVYLYMKGSKLPTKESMLQYFVSMRSENHFHEEICECIYKRLMDTFEFEKLMVACLYTRRGGIDINPVRVSSPALLLEVPNLMNVDMVVTKTMRQ
jgi:7-cyano-7-deazaguanine reductase